MNESGFVQYLDGLMEGYQRAQILITALRAGVFGLVEEGRDADGVAEALGWSPKGARMLLDGLVALELVEKKGGTTYRSAPIAVQCLLPGAPTDQTHILEHKAYGWHTWARLEEAVRTGTGLPRDRKRRSPDELRAFICGMDDIARLSARSILEAVDLSPYRRLLDLGAGPGTYAVAFLQAHDAMRATLFDVPDVIPIAREQVEAAKLEKRVEYVSGDMTSASLEPGHDLILISNIIHSFSSGTNSDLVRRCHEALAPGGLLIIKDFLLDPGRTGPPFGLIFALHMLIHTEAGDTYTQEEVAGWTTEAGLPPGELIDLSPQSRLWLVRKAE